jgi:hypothetical protein
VGDPGLASENWVFRSGPIARRNPGLRSETWATHLLSEEGRFIFERALEEVGFE